MKKLYQHQVTFTKKFLKKELNLSGWVMSVLSTIKNLDKLYKFIKGECDLTVGIEKIRPQVIISYNGEYLSSDLQTLNLIKIYTPYNRFIRHT